MSSESWRRRLDVAASLGVIVASLMFIVVMAGGLIVRSRTVTADSAGDNAVPDRALATATAASRGSVEAEVALVVFSDFECPFCAQFARATLPTIMRDYVDSGRVMLVFKHYPLEAIHPTAFEMSATAACAGTKDLFWEFHDALFERSDRKGRERLDQVKSRFNLTGSELEACISGPGTLTVDADLAEARALGLKGTPSLVFGVIGPNGEVQASRLESGALPAPAVARILDEMLLASAAALGDG